MKKFFHRGNSNQILSNRTLEITLTFIHQSRGVKSGELGNHSIIETLLPTQRAGKALRGYFKYTPIPKIYRILLELKIF